MRTTLFARAAAVGALSSLLLASSGPLARAAEVRDIAFPAAGEVTVSDNYGEPRSGGRTHEGVDIMGQKMQPLLAAVDGRVDEVVYPEASWGYAVVLRDDDGYTYHYLHVNNDTPGTDDGAGGAAYAYVSGIVPGARVTRGQHIAYMGDSGNAESVGAHLHFEIRMPGGAPIDPYPSLVAAQSGGGASYSAAAASNASPDINADKGLLPSPDAACSSGSLVKSQEFAAVYYCGADGKRYVFPNSQTYLSWYPSYAGMTTLSKEQVAAIPLGKLVTYRPGVRLVKIRTEPKVYAVAPGGVLRHVTTPTIAAALYGTDWTKKVDDIPDEFFTGYAIGDPVTSAQ